MSWVREWVGGIGHWIRENAFPLACGVALVSIVGACCAVGWGVNEQRQTYTLTAQNTTLARQNKALTKHLIVVGNIHHAEADRKDAEIETLLTQVKTLLQQHSASFAQQQAYDADVLAFAQAIEGELTALCSVSSATCPPLPVLTSGPG